MPPSAAVTLQFLLVSEDHSTLKKVQAALDALGSSMNCSTSAGAARLYLSSHRVNGIILDIPLPSAAELIAAIRQAGTNRRAFIFVCIGEGQMPSEALKGGANVLLHKPLDPDLITLSIKPFYSIMDAERRRYFRFQVTIPVTLTRNTYSQRAMVENLSDGGMAVSARVPLERSELAEFSFELPFGPQVAGQAQVMWTNDKGIMGLEFRLLHEHSREHLSDWLKNKSLQS
jgi:response regulator RpfG family c-di-GMP phosphodiesterase